MTAFGSWWRTGNRGLSGSEDDALLLRAYQLRVGKLKHRGEEICCISPLVQDFSPVEILVLMDICDEHRSLTLAGDTRQHISQDAGFASWSSFLHDVGLRSSALQTLDVSYRSTHPITRFAVAILQDNDEPLPTTLRDGPTVELFQFSEHGACTIFLAEELQSLLANEPLANVALLTPNEELSETYAQGLGADVPNVRQIHDQVFSFTPGVDVVKSIKLKLEFDYVIIVEPSARFYPDTDHTAVCCMLRQQERFINFGLHVWVHHHQLFVRFWNEYKKIMGRLKVMLWMSWWDILLIICLNSRFRRCWIPDLYKSRFCSHCVP